MDRKNLFSLVVICGYLIVEILGDELLLQDKDVCFASNHYTDPEFTCCGNARYLPPLKNYTDACWDAKEKVVDGAWSSYKCIIDKRLDGKELTLQNFGDIMTAVFPSDIKNKINSEIEKADSIEYKNAEYPQFQELMGIRETYYRIEKYVCLNYEEREKEIPMDDHPKRCYNWKERYHGAGDCCADTPIPFQMNPEPYYSHWTLTNFTATSLMGLVGRYNWKNWTYSNNLAPCFKTARLILSNIIPYKDFAAEVKSFAEVNYKNISDLFVPKFIPQNIREKMIDFMAKNITLDPTIVQIAENPVEQFFSPYEFKNYNSNMTRFLYWRCEAHRKLFYEMKNYNLMQHC